ncbi:LacI family DNA-binding transcriptional regulator [Cellulomonas hominis]
MPRPSPRRPSVIDVAQQAGVSVGTVSNVLNYPAKVAPATRERVQAVMQELSFVRNGAARQLRAGDNTMVGTLLLDIRNPFFTDLARGMEDRLAEAHHILMLADTDNDADREAMFLRMFEEHGVAGVLAVPTTPDLTPYLDVQERGVRVVLVDSPSPTRELSSVAVDDTVGGALAARHLLGRGHREITFINGAHTIRQAAARRVGVDRAVREAGLEPDRVVREITVALLNASGGDAALVAIAEVLGQAPPAVMCVNDLVAIGVQRALRRLGGTELVTSVDVVGYDDIEIARELALPLTSVRQPAYEMGRRAAEILLAQDRQVEHVLFQPELVVRASSQGGHARA